MSSRFFLLVVASAVLWPTCCSASLVVDFDLTTTGSLVASGTDNGVDFDLTLTPTPSLISDATGAGVTDSSLDPGELVMFTAALSNVSGGTAVFDGFTAVETSMGTTTFASPIAGTLPVSTLDPVQLVTVSAQVTGTPTSVPEPSAALSLLALLGFGAVRRRRH